MLPVRLEFRADNDAGFFAEIPAKGAVFVLRGDGGEPYISKTANLRRRLIRLLGAPDEATRRLNLRDRVRTVEYALTGSDFENTFRLYQLLREHFPDKYRERLRIRPAPLVRLHLENRFARASVTTRVGRLGGASQYYGPFASRAAAEKFANDALDFFKLRRCVEDLDPDPAFPGCIYSEMKMCLAPCFRGCTDEEYATETQRVTAFFDSGGHSLVREIETARDEASGNLEFEAAAAQHARLEKLKPVLGQLPEIVHRLDRLDGVMIQPSAEAEAVTFFRVQAGRIAEPLIFSLKQPEEKGAKPHSMEARINEALAAAPAMPKLTAEQTMEHVALLKRWFYRTAKVGEIFFADENGLPMRRVVRGVSRVFKGEKPMADLSESSKEYWLMRAREQ